MQPFFPLDIVSCPGPYHGIAQWRSAFHHVMKQHPQGRSFRMIYELKDVELALERNIGNTLIIDIGFSGHIHEYTLPDIDVFLTHIRRKFPKVVIILLGDKAHYDEICKLNTRYNHYLVDHMGPMADAMDKLDKCVQWLYSQYEYDLCFSFAGEDRVLVKSLAEKLSRTGVRCFYDEFEQAHLLGRNLYEYFHSLYRVRSRYCLMAGSAHYGRKLWTNHERRAAQERTFQEMGSDYILPLRIDDTPIPGLPATAGYIDASIGEDKIIELISKKLGVHGAEKLTAHPVIWKP